MEFFRKAVRVGNSAGVILPKRLLGSDVKISVVSMPISIKKEAFRLLDDFFDDIIGIYIIKKMPAEAEVLAVSDSAKKIIEDERIKIAVVPLSQIKKDIKTNFVLRSRLEKAEVIFNKNLLSKLQKDARGV